MRYITKAALFVLVIFISQQVSADNKLRKSVSNAVETAQKYANGVLLHNRYFAKAVETHSWLQKTFRHFTQRKPKKIEERDKLSLELADLPRDLNILKARLLQRTSETSEKFDKFYDGIQKIQHYYKIYQQIAQFRENITHMTVTEFAETVLSVGRHGVTKILDSMYDALTDTTIKGKNALLHLADHEMVKELLCMRRQSSQRLLYNLYQSVLMTESKGFIMLSFANIFTKDDDNSVNTELNSANTSLVKRVETFYEELKESFADTSRDLWRCDPEEHVEGLTYEKIGPLFQKYIMYEPDAYDEDGLSTWNFRGCVKSCPSYTDSTPAFCHTDYCKSLQPEKVCTGNIQDCEYFENTLNICHSKEAERRYEYIETKTGQFFGRNSTCEDNAIQTVKGKFQYVVRCSYCFCTCVDNSERYTTYISLKPVLANISNNTVVTGMRIQKFKNVVHIQIQEGKLSRNGKIDFNSVIWQPLPASVDLSAKEDYVKVSWDQRSFALDDLEGASDRALTGLRFRLEDNYIKLDIHTTAFDLKTGSVMYNQSQWSSESAATQANRSELVLSEPGVPTRYGNHLPDSAPNQFVSLTTSDLKSDAGQTVVPFFDAQPVESKIPVLLSGAGLFHKGTPSSAGFVALKAITYDVKKLFEEA